MSDQSLEVTIQAVAARRAERPVVPGPVGDAAYAADGTDLTLIHWMLDMTPSERLDVLTSGARSLLSLRHGADEP